MAYDDDQSGITSAFANPYVSIPYAILNGVLAGASPGTARLSSGLNAGLGMGMSAEKYSNEEMRKKRLSTSLDALSNATKPVTTEKSGIDLSAPGTTISPMPSDMRLSQATNPLAPPAALPTFNQTTNEPMYSPQVRAYLQAINRDDPKAAAAMVGSLLTKEQDKPVAVGRNGALVDPKTGKVLYQAPLTADRPTIVGPGATALGPDGKPIYTAPAAPPRPTVVPPGSTMVGPDGKAGYTNTNARPVSEEDKKLKGAETNAANARAGASAASAEENRAQARLHEATREKVIADAKEAAKNPKGQTTGALGSALQALNAEQGLNKTEEAENREARSVIRQELAVRQRTANAPLIDPNAATGNEARGTEFSGLPDPKLYGPKKGSGNQAPLFRGTGIHLGKNFRSNGTEWKEVK